MTKHQPIPADKVLQWRRPIVGKEAIEGMYVACVSPQTELQARDDLLERGIKAVVVSHITKRRAHRTGKLTKVVETVKLTGFVFVAAADYAALSEILAFPFINRILGSGELSSRLGPDELKWLKEMLVEPVEGAGDQPPEWFKVGQFYNVIEGLLSTQLDLEVEITEILGGGNKPWTAMVTAPGAMFSHEVELPLDSLRPV